MIFYKRLVCVILCLSMILSLVGCGQAETTPTQSEAAPTEETQVAVESFLAIAQGFIDKEAFDSAIAVLEQAREISEDTRIDEMLAQIEEMRSIPLDVVVSQEPVNLKSGTVQIHKVSAVERHDGFVRFTIDYTASAGMYVHILGTGLDYISHFHTHEGRDSFVFELPATDLRTIGRKLRIAYAFSNNDQFIMDLLTNWPGDVMTAATDITLHQGDTTPVSGCEIHSVTVQAVDEKWLYYSVDYTAPRAGMSIFVNIGENEPIYSLNTDHGRRQFAFLLDREEAQTEEVFRVRITENDSSNNGASVEFYPEDYIIPGPMSAAPVREVRDLPFAVYNTMENGTGYQIHEVSVRILESGFVCYQIDYTAPEGLPYISNLSHGFVNGSSKVYPVIGGTEESGTAKIYITLEELQNAEETLIRFSGATLPEYYELNISHGWYDAATEGEPVEDALSLPFNVWKKPSSGDYDFHSCTAQPLDNGYIRFTLSFTAPEQRLCYVLDYPENFSINCSSGRQNGTQTIVLDIPADAPIQDGILGFRCNMYLSPEGSMFVDIDASRVFGVSTSNMKPIIVNVLYPQKEAQREGTDEQDNMDTLVQQLAETAKEMTVTPAIDAEAAMKVDTSMIQPLEVTKKLVTPKAQDGIQPYKEYYSQTMPEKADISDNPALAYSLTFSDKTEFSDNMPASYDSDALLEWGKDPGLNVDVLHELGYTGKGAVIAYVDQPIHDHAAYANVNLHNTNNSNAATSMHGPAVLSLLAGKDIGTAPEAEVWFYGAASWEGDHTTSAECLYQIIEKNKTLPDDEKITMIGFSDNIASHKKNMQALADAVKACEEAGIMVWFCGEYAAAAFLPLSDKNNIDNVVRDGVYGSGTPELVHVPAGSRTTATGECGEYIYWASGGLSWTMPYVLGLYAIVNEINPSLRQDDLRKMIAATAYQKDGMKIVNPVEFVAAALEGVGRTEDAQELRAAAKANIKYTYAVMNKSKMTQEDIIAAENYLKEISGSAVLVVDSSGIASAQQLYTILQADHIQRGGSVAGVQLFGNADLIPAFEIGYKVQMESGVDSMGSMLTDLFYGNFNNAAKDLSKSYNVMDHFEKGWNVQLVPEWKVARLPLAKGEFKTFFDQYMDFATTAGLGQQTLVNFSNPIFANHNHTDDMGYFLNRLVSEFGMDIGDYRLYGNQLGQYPVTTNVLGGFTAENLTAENQSGICEFIINTHGQKNNVDKCWFEGGKEKRESLMNSDNINDILSGNPYYLDMWSCNNGEAMKNNITTAALSGKCVGMFSNTHVISNNGVNNQASLQTMTQSNFCYFYLHYLKALSEGVSRSDAFFAAQQAYGNALIVDSQNGIRGEGNYQFNLYNLLGYHNFGVIEPNPAFSCISSTIS